MYGIRQIFVPAKQLGWPYSMTERLEEMGEWVSEDAGAAAKPKRDPRDSRDKKSLIPAPFSLSLMSLRSLVSLASPSGGLIGVDGGLRALRPDAQAHPSGDLRRSRASGDHAGSQLSDGGLARPGGKARAAWNQQQLIALRQRWFEQSASVLQSRMVLHSQAQ